MEYQVSEKVRESFEKLTGNEKVQKALAFMEKDHENIVEKQIELTLIPSPTYHEEKKAARLSGGNISACGPATARTVIDAGYSGGSMGAAGGWQGV